MNRDDKVMIRLGLVFAFLGFLAPFWTMFVPLNLHEVLVVCTAVSSVLCMFVLVRGAIPRNQGRPKQ